MKKPLVSVVIPVFNGSLYLREAVGSVLASSYRNFEILLIDDGSNDQSRKICRTLVKQYPHKVKFFSFRKNKGLCHVLNFALRQACGKFICRLNQDDLMRKDRLKVQVEFLKRHPEVTAVGSWIRIFSRTKKKSKLLKFLKTDKEIKKVWYVVSPFSDPSVMYRKAVALKVDGYWQTLWPADDTHLWYRLGQWGQLANIQKALTFVRWHSQAASFKYFRRLAISTYKMHLWTHFHLKPAALPVHLFWLGQLIAGLLLPPTINWSVYRLIKKIVNQSDQLKKDWRQILANIKTVVKVSNQPAKLRTSGI